MSPRWHPKRCKFPGCNAPPDAITARGWCLQHGNERIVANIDQLQARRGPFFERWYEGLHLAFEHSRRLDDVTAND